MHGYYKCDGPLDDARHHDLLRRHPEQRRDTDLKLGGERIVVPRPVGCRQLRDGRVERYLVLYN